MLITIAVLAALLVLQTVVNVIERRRHERKETELLNRVMSRDYGQFASFEKAEIITQPAPRRTLVDETGLIEVEAEDDE